MMVQRKVAEGCEVCDDGTEPADIEALPLYRGGCARCWIESVEEGVHAWGDLPEELRDPAGGGR